MRITTIAIVLSFVCSSVSAQDYPDLSDTTKVIVLEKVVVTALGITRQERSLGYSATVVKGSQINNNVIDPISALQGKVAGLNISGSDGGLFGRSKISLRGASTLGDNNQPLIVIDGIVINSDILRAYPDYPGGANDFGNELKNLNAADIESISALKGAAATALYGSRGLNGAIVITTKNGNATKGIRVSVSQSTGFDMVTAVPKLQKLYGPGWLAGDVYYGEVDGNGDYFRWDTEQFNLNGDGKPTLIGGDECMFGPRFDGSEIIRYDGTSDFYSPVKNGYRDFYRAGWQSNTNVAVQGGYDKGSFYVSAGYRYSGGTMPGNSLDRTTLLAKGNHKLGAGLI